MPRREHADFTARNTPGITEGYSTVIRGLTQQEDEPSLQWTHTQVKTSKRLAELKDEGQIKLPPHSETSAPHLFSQPEKWKAGWKGYARRDLQVPFIRLNKAEFCKSQQTAGQWSGLSLFYDHKEFHLEIIKRWPENPKCVWKRSNTPLHDPRVKKKKKIASALENTFNSMMMKIWHFIMCGAEFQQCRPGNGQPYVHIR